MSEEIVMVKADKALELWIGKILLGSVVLALLMMIVGFIRF